MALNGYAIAAVVILAYGVVVYLLWRRGWIGRDRSISLLGPALMIKTKRGRDFIDRVGQRARAWTIAGDVAIVIGAVTMVAMVVLLLFDAVLSFGLSASQAPSAQEALGIPGINPIIPIGYGIVALVIGVVLHELFHGFVARAQKIRVKTLGILWCVVPVGAFVEPDEEDMEKAGRRRRDRVAAAGILANFALAIVFFLVLSAVVSTSLVPNANGVGVYSVVSGFPAQNATIGAGDIITSVNGTPTPNYNALESALNATRPGVTVPISFYSSSAGHLVNTVVTPTRRTANSTTGYLGVVILGITPSQIQATLANPFSSGPLVLGGGLTWIALPFYFIEPISGSTAAFFHFTGPLASVNPGTVWIGLNLLYWLAWMNLLLGASNALPLIPLDGGLLVRDYAAAFAARLKKGWDAARLDAFGGSVAVASSLVVVLLIVWQFVVPRL